MVEWFSNLEDLHLEMFRRVEKRDEPEDAKGWSVVPREMRSTVGLSRTGSSTVLFGNDSSGDPVVFHTPADMVGRHRCKLRVVIDLTALQMVLMAVIGWLDGQEREAVVFRFSAGPEITPRAHRS